MFNLIRAILKNIKSLFHHKQKLPVKREIPPERLSQSQKLLLMGGLAMLLLGMVYGGIYGVFFHGKLHELEAEHMRMAIYYISQGDFESAEKYHEKTVDIGGVIEAIPSVHSHINSFALISLIISGIIPKIKLKEKWKVAGAILLLGGGLVMAIGIILQPAVSKTIGMITAIIGGSGVMAAVALYMWGLFRFIKND